MTEIYNILFAIVIIRKWFIIIKINNIFHYKFVRNVILLYLINKNRLGRTIKKYTISII